MCCYPPWQPDATRILTRRELATILEHLSEKAARSRSAALNLALFRLACCCGLRVSEIAGLRMRDVVMAGGRPYVHVRRDVAKSNRARKVPLWWDVGIRADLASHKRMRRECGAGDDDPLLTSYQADRRGRPLSRFTLRRRFLKACHVLGDERLRHLTIHHGRHTFISHALAGGRTLAEVRDAAGHASVAVTSG